MRVFVCCTVIALAVCTAEGARRVDAREQLEMGLAALGGSSHRAKRDARRLAVRDLMGAGPQVDLQVKHTGKTAQGTKLWKLEETFRGRPVFDAQLTVETDESGVEVLDASGTVIQDIDKDTDGQTTIYANEAINKVLEKFGDTKDVARDIKVEIKVFVDSSDIAFTGFQVEYKVEDTDRPRRPTAIVDGRNGSIVMSWNAMTTFCPDATGIGGNGKVGKVFYDGIHWGCPDVTRVGDVCYLENEHVRVVDMGQEKFYNITDAMSYDCKNATDAVNGAFSPAMDAFFIGTAAYKMFGEWYGMKPVKNDQLIIRVHFGEDYPNAFWNGDNATFGDGRSGFFPFVSIDLVGHEIGHALVEQNSGLIWFNQAGAINEAFSDITGEVLEYYLRGQDWLTGADILPEDEAVRYFIDPTENFLSIGTFQEFVNYMEPHETAGILAHAFYSIVEENGQSIREAYRVFLHANEMYWHHMSSITAGTCELMKSAYDLGQPGEPYKTAFEKVGIEVCDIGTHVRGLRNNETVTGIMVSNSTRPVFTFTAPGEWTQTVFVKAFSSEGDVHITITNQTWMQAHDPDSVDILAEGDGFASFNITDVSKNEVSITLSSDSPTLWTDVSVEAGFTCLEAGQASHGYFEYLRRVNCEGHSY